MPLAVTSCWLGEQYFLTKIYELAKGSGLWHPVTFPVLMGKNLLLVHIFVTKFSPKTAQFYQFLMTLLFQIKQCLVRTRLPRTCTKKLDHVTNHNTTSLLLWLCKRPHYTSGCTKNTIHFWKARASILPFNDSILSRNPKQWLVIFNVLLPELKGLLDDDWLVNNLTRSKNVTQIC